MEAIEGPRIAIVYPHSENHAYSEKNLTNYIHAVKQSGGQPIVVRLDQSIEHIKALFDTCHGALLTGSPADVDPALYGEERHKETSPHDHKRYEADNLLISESYRTKKPVMGICYGCQSLNVYHGGTLQQHVFDCTDVPHTAGAPVHKAHTITIHKGSNLASIFEQHVTCCAQPRKPDPRKQDEEEKWGDHLWTTNSSHHQAVKTVGKGLRVVAISNEDGVVEALERDPVHRDDEHYLIGVQWHPERFFDEDHLSQVLFKTLVNKALYHKRNARDCTSHYHIHNGGDPAL